MHTEAHQDYIRQARHFIYISGTGGKDGNINRYILDYLLRLPTRHAHNTEKYKDVINELKKITRNNMFGFTCPSDNISSTNFDLYIPICTPTKKK